ncbi:hypothetical protein MMAN_58300 [Mycobacterium mantenii]|uniref:Uncharacterized protein n=1 Tax=Mycobacterium mantenii TaxID=560555 RepID=A0ABM7K1F8_MYCNT|nr:hypothetical protein MMAN_58300 [Mycobacterium mantenii]
MLRWLRAGYPRASRARPRAAAGPAAQHPLTEEQITEVVRNITADGSPAIADGVIDRDEIAHFISDMTHYDAGPENIIRVAATLAAVGWPLAGIDVSEVIPGDEWGEAAEIAARGHAPEGASGVGV